MMVDRESNMALGSFLRAVFRPHPGEQAALASLAKITEQIERRTDKISSMIAGRDDALDRAVDER